MFDKAKHRRDDFAFSFRGYRAMAGVVAPVIVSDERFRLERKTDSADHHNIATSHNWVPAEQAGC